MTSKTSKYWIATAEGTRGQVDGDEERDRWTPRGWQVVDEPADTDFVYMSHPDLDEPARFAHGAAETWQQMGWSFSPPPEPVDVTKDPAVFEQPPPQPKKKPAAAKPAAVSDMPEEEVDVPPAAGTDKNAKE